MEKTSISQSFRRYNHLCAVLECQKIHGVNGMTNYTINYKGHELVIGFDGCEGTAPILHNGIKTGHCTADARHSLYRAVRIVLCKMFGGNRGDMMFAISKVEEAV
jgi:hypothetical protein